MDKEPAAKAPVTPAAEVVADALHTIIMQETSISAFPPAEDLDTYERHYPGFLKELMRRAAEAQQHEQDMTRLRLTGPLQFALRGQLLGAVIVLASVAGIVTCAYLDQPVIAGALGFVTLFPVVSLFIRNPLSAKDPKRESSASDS